MLFAIELSSSKIQPSIVSHKHENHFDLSILLDLHQNVTRDKLLDTPQGTVHE